MRKLPFMWPIANSMPVVYESQLSYYEYLNNLYSYINQEINPVIDEMQQLIDQDWENMKADIEAVKASIVSINITLSNHQQGIAALNEWKNSTEEWKAGIDTFRSNTTNNIHQLQLKINELETNITTLGADVASLSAEFSSYKESSNSRLNTLEAWQTTIESWKSTLTTQIEIINGKLTEIYDRIIKLEKGTTFLTFYNFSGTSVNVDSILAEDTEILTWNDLIGKTLTIGVLFTDSSTSSAGTSIMKIGTSETDVLNLIKPETLSSVRGHSLVVDITVFRNDENEMIYIEWKPHFSSNANRIFGGMKATGLNSQDQIYLKLDLQGFAAETSAQLVIAVK